MKFDIYFIIKPKPKNIQSTVNDLSINKLLLLLSILLNN